MDDVGQSIVVEHEGQELKFWVTFDLTFAGLREDLCQAWGLQPSRISLCDPIKGQIWPSKALVKDAMAKFNIQRVAVLMRDTDVHFSHRFPRLSKSLTRLVPMEASGGNDGSGNRRFLKSPIRLQFLADPPSAEASSELFLSGEIKLGRAGPKSAKLVWERPPETVLLMIKIGSDIVLRYAETVGNWLKTKSLQVVVEDQMADKLPDFVTFSQLLRQRGLPQEQNASAIDFIVTLGGDGTVLHAASLFRSSVPPVISFNLGSLGFLTRQQLPNFRNDICSLLEGDMFLTLRARLTCRLLRKASDASGDWEVVLERQVLNEVVIDKGGSSNLTNLDTYCDGVYVTTVQGDGVIISTATGSTAYSLSCGGTMIHPSVPSIAFTPICPHSLSFRPVVFPAQVELRITNSKLARASAFVSFDGHSRTELSGDDVVSITTSDWPVPSVSSSDDISSWFSSLAECLHWNDRKQQNAPLIDSSL